MSNFIIISNISNIEIGNVANIVYFHNVSTSITTIYNAYVDNASVNQMSVQLYIQQ